MGALAFYRIEIWPPETPFLEYTICQSWFQRARKDPAQLNK